MRVRPALCVLGISAMCATAGQAGAQLLGVEPELPAISFDNQGSTMYDAATGTLLVDASPTAVRRSMSEPPRIVFPATSSSLRVFQIGVIVDSSGALVSGISGDDLYVEGRVDLDGDGVDDADGVLLTGEVVAFGSADSGGPTDLFDFEVVTTGGLLAALIGDRVGIQLTSEESDFAGDFTIDFMGEAKGTAGGICVDEDVEVFCDAQLIDLICDNGGHHGHRRHRSRRSWWCTNRWDHDHGNECEWSYNDDGVLVIKSDSAVLRVTATDLATGEVVECETELCDVEYERHSTHSSWGGHDDDDDDDRHGHGGWWRRGWGHHHNHRRHRDRDCRKLIEIDYGASGGCEGVDVVGVIDTGCGHVPVEPGDLIKLDCGNDRGHHGGHHHRRWWRRGWSWGGWGHWRH